MALHHIEREIFSCPYILSNECYDRLDCHPIPGVGSSHPEYLILGLNPALRGEIWCQYCSLETMKHGFLQECMDSRYGYGRLLKRLKEIIPNFRVTETVYITDIAKCPVKKGSPSKIMLKKCYSAYLERTIRELVPKFIITLGDIPAKFVTGFSRKGRDIQSARITIANRSYWVISAPHPSQAADIEAIASNIHNAMKNPKDYAVRHVNKDTLKSKKEEVRTRVMNRLIDLGYRKRGYFFKKGGQVVNIVISSEFGSYIRIKWKEQWKNDFAVIYDYSVAKGPTCIVPITQLFASSFVRQKRAMTSYSNSQYWWTQLFPRNHELVELVLNFQDRWDLL